MPNVENLRSLGDLPPEEHAEISRRGGIASGETRRRKKNMREVARALLESPLVDEPETEAALEALGIEKTQQGAILLAAARKSKYGDIEAARFIRDTSGQAPTQTGELSGPDGGAIGIDLAGYTDDQLRQLLSDGADDADGADADGADADADGADADGDGADDAENPG